jgi:pimeloyl-ACP methyl ester carboxylesterase
MKRFARILLIALACAGMLTALAAAWFFLPFMTRVQRVPADPAAGFHADYYLYLGPAAKQRAEREGQTLILVQPNNSGTNSDYSEVHRKDAWWTTFGRSGLADELGVVLLVPAFVRPAQDWQIYTHALDRDCFTTARADLSRPDLQLLAMVDDARLRLRAAGILVQAKILIQGYSASGMFADRFTILHPDRVLACAAGSPGGWPMAPAAEQAGEPLPYPAGVADLATLCGRPFDAEAYRQVAKLFVLGDRDDNDALDFRDGWEEAAAAQVDRLFGADPQARWPQAERLHAAAGTGARFLLVPGAGHDRKKLQRHSTDFFLHVLSESAQGGD